MDLGDVVLREDRETIGTLSWTRRLVMGTILEAIRIRCDWMRSKQRLIERQGRSKAKSVCQLSMNTIHHSHCTPKSTVTRCTSTKKRVHHTVTIIQVHNNIDKTTRHLLDIPVVTFKGSQDPVPLTNITRHPAFRIAPTRRKQIVETVGILWLLPDMKRLSIAMAHQPQLRRLQTTSTCRLHLTKVTISMLVLLVRITDIHKTAPHVRPSPTLLGAYLNYNIDHSAASHQQYASGQYDTYNTQPQNSGYNPESYNNTAGLAAVGATAHPTDYYSSPPPAQHQARNYTLGGGSYDPSYGANQVSDHTQPNNQYFPSPHQTPFHPSSPPQLSSSPMPIDTNIGGMPMPGAATTSPVRGPRNIGSPVHQYSDSPPSYDNAPGAWREKL
jgi:hypothetical protein